MKKIFQQKRWIIFIVLALIILGSGFIYLYFVNPILTISVLVVVGIGFAYLYFTNQLNLPLRPKWKKIEKWFLGSIAGVTLLTCFTTLLYGHIFPNSDKQLLEGQNIITEEVRGISEIQKRLEEMAIEQNRPIEELIQENKELKEKLRKESVASISQELQTEIDQFFSEFKYPEARNSIDIFLEEHENIRQKDLAKLHYQKSLTYEAEINYQKAKEELEIAIALDKENSEIANQYGVIFDTLGDYGKAIEYFEKSLEIKLKTLDKEHPNVAVVYNNLGIAWYNEGDYGKAIEYFEKSLGIELKTLGKEHPSIALGYNNLGTAWNGKGDYGKAIEYQEKALEIWLKIPDKERPSIATVYNNLGTTWYSKGDYDKAIEYYEKSLEIKFKTLDEEHPNIAAGYNNLGTAWHGEGDYDKAIVYYEKALKILRKVFQNGHPQIDITEKNIRTAKRARDS